MEANEQEVISTAPSVSTNKTLKTIVVKLSESKKTMLVGHKKSKYTIGYDFAWCSNPDQLEIGDSIEGFNPSSRVDIFDKEGNPVLHEDKTPVQRWVF